MTAPYAARQQPCPDCGAPVRPDVDQLCPACGYPLMFLRPQAAPDARSVARAPGERDDPTGLLPPPGGPAPTRVSPAVGAGPPPGWGAPSGRPAAACPRCGYANEPVRIRCERCGHELRPARPQPAVLGPAAPAAAPRRAGWWWLLLLLLVPVLLALLVLVVWLFTAG